MGKIGNPRKTDVTDAQIVAAYRDSRSAYKVEETLGVSCTTIYKVLRRHNVDRVGTEFRIGNTKRFTDAQETVIRAEYEAGDSFADLLAKYGGTFHSIKKAITRAGGTLTPVSPPTSKFEQALIPFFYQAGISRSQLSRDFGRPLKFVSNILRRQGFVYKPKARENHPNWSGGRYVNESGYIEIHLDPADPLFVMARQSGYALEHRVIMARKLGRPLLATETVHHKNGVRSDNDPANLELRQGHHGKHVVMCCLNCGSRNVGPIAIEEVHNE